MNLFKRFRNDESTTTQNPKTKPKTKKRLEAACWSLRSVSQSVSQNCYPEENQKTQKYQNKNTVPSRSSRTIFIQQKPERTRTRTNATISKLMDITTILPPVYLLCKQPKNKTKQNQKKEKTPKLEEFCTSKKQSLQRKRFHLPGKPKF
jgi:hypothetical protein